MAGISEDPQGPALRLVLAAAVILIVLRGALLLEDPNRLLCAAVASLAARGTDRGEFTRRA